MLVGAKAYFLGHLKDHLSRHLLGTASAALRQEMCDRILVIYKGEIVGEYAKDDVDGNTLLAVASGAAERKEAS